MDKRGPLNRTLGENLRLLRHARGRSQQEFAHDLGYDLVFVEDAMTSIGDGNHEFAVRNVFPLLGRVRTTEEIVAAAKEA